MTTPRYSRAAAEAHVSVEGTAVSRAPRVVFVGTDPAALQLPLCLAGFLSRLDVMKVFSHVALALWVFAFTLK